MNWKITNLGKTTSCQFLMVTIIRHMVSGPKKDKSIGEVITDQTKMNHRETL